MSSSKLSVALWGAFLVLALLQARIEPAAATDGARIVVYFEVPEGAAPEVTLHLSSLRIATADDTIRVAPRVRTLSATELAGRQIRLGEAFVPPGILRTFLLDYEAIEAKVGAAVVSPSPPPGGTRIVLDLAVQGESATLVVLRWIARPVDPEAPHHEPAIELHERAVPPLGSLAFVSNADSGYLTILDPFAMKVVDVLEVGSGPRDLAYSRRFQRLYVAVAGSDEIVTVNALNRQILRRVPLRLGDEPSRLLLTEAEDELYVLNTGTETMSVMVTQSLQEAWRVPLRERPRGLAYDARRNVVFVSSEFAGRILAYDTRLQTELTSITADSSPTEILFSDLEGQLFVASSARRRLLSLDLRLNELAGELTLCGTIDGLAYHPQSGRLYCALGDCKEVAISIPDQSLEVGAIRLPGRPGLMAFDPRYRHLLVTLPEDDQVAICSANNQRLISLVEVGSRPFDVVVP
jgi:hypothetical protein